MYAPAVGAPTRASRETASWHQYAERQKGWRVRFPLIGRELVKECGFDSRAAPLERHLARVAPAIRGTNQEAPWLTTSA
jgi:hypothetical protein